MRSKYLQMRLININTSMESTVKPPLLTTSIEQ